MCRTPERLLLGTLVHTGAAVQAREGAVRVTIHEPRNTAPCFVTFEISRYLNKVKLERRNSTTFLRNSGAGIVSHNAVWMTYALPMEPSQKAHSQYPCDS